MVLSVGQRVVAYVKRLKPEMEQFERSNEIGKKASATDARRTGDKRSISFLLSYSLRQPPRPGELVRNILSILL